MQKGKIQELEEKISTYSLTGKIPSSGSESETARTDVNPEELSNEIKVLSLKIAELESCLAAHEVQQREADEAAKHAHEQLCEQERNLTLSRSKIQELEDALVSRSEDLEGMVRGEAAIAAEADSLRRRAEVAEKTGMWVGSGILSCYDSSPQSVLLCYIDLLVWMVRCYAAI